MATAAAGVELPSEPARAAEPPKATARKRVPKAAPEPAATEAEESELKEALAGPVKNGELAALAKNGISTVQEFLEWADQDPGELMKVSGITKSRLVKAVDAAKTWLAKHGGE